MSILPSFLEKQASEQAAVGTAMTVPKEYGINFQTGKLTGEIVEGKEAVKVWVWLCLKTQRFKYPIYSWNYGWDSEQYIGQTLTPEYIATDAEDEITEALKVNQYIEGIEDFSCEVEDNTVLHISFRVITKFGDVEVTDGTVQ